MVDGKELIVQSLLRGFDRLVAMLLGFELFRGHKKYREVVFKIVCVVSGASYRPPVDLLPGGYRVVTCSG